MATGDDGVDVRRIARNAGWLYARLFVVTVAELFSVRIIMNALGVSGYGLFSAVSGAVSLIFALQWTMEMSVRRFLCVEIGKGDADGLRRSFSAGLMLSVSVCILFVLFGETGGRWFVQNRMTYDEKLADAASYVLQGSIVRYAVETLSLPFEALIIATERMSFLAKVSVVEASLSFLAACAVSMLGGNGQEVYVLLLAIKSVIVLCISWNYCRVNFSSVITGLSLEWRWFGDQGLFFLKTSLSDVANLFKGQGVNMLLNVFGGVSYNASWSMARRLESALYGIVANFQQAYFPQIVKLWSNGNNRLFFALIVRTMRWSLIVIGICVVPLLLLTRTVLSIWLGETLPPAAVAFVRCAAISIIFDTLSAPLHTAIVATGRIFEYNVCISLVTASGFFMAWGCFAAGLPAWTSVASVAIANVLSFLYRLGYVRRHLGVAWVSYLRKVVVRWICYNPKK